MAEIKIRQKNVINLHKLLVEEDRRYQLANDKRAEFAVNVDGEIFQCARNDVIFYSKEVNAYYLFNASVFYINCDEKRDREICKNLFGFDITTLEKTVSEREAEYTFYGNFIFEAKDGRSGRSITRIIYIRNFEKVIFPNANDINDKYLELLEKEYAYSLFFWESDCMYKILGKVSVSDDCTKYGDYLLKGTLVKNSNIYYFDDFCKCYHIFWFFKDAIYYVKKYNNNVPLPRLIRIKTSDVLSFPIGEINKLIEVCKKMNEHDD